jgi:Right handed beta helix region
MQTVGRRQVGVTVGAALVAVVCAILVGSVLAGAGSGLAPASAPGAGSSSSVRAAFEPFEGLPCSVTVPGENVADNAVQTAINAASPGAVICLAPGLYPEQLHVSTANLTIVGSGNSTNPSSGSVLEPNAPLAFSTYDFDSGTPAAALVSVTNTTGVELEYLAVSGANASASFTGCGQDYYGVAFQNASGKLLGATVTGIELPPSLFGCQPGLAVYADNGYFTSDVAPSPAIAVTIESSTFTAYDKGGIVCDDLGESCTIAGNTVTGVGGTDLIAQNGIQVAFGASALVFGNDVTGNHYLPGLNADYFSPTYTASGILVYDAGAVLNVSANVLAGNDLGIAVAGTASASVSNNTISQGYAYGITFDLNTSAAWLGLPVYSTDTPWTSTATGNTIANVNVGLLVYDDNVTVHAGSITDVNVSLEAMTDGAGPYYVNVSSLFASSNVSAALLGNVSSYQATAGFFPKATGRYSLVSDSFAENPFAPIGGVRDGVVLNGTSALVDAVSVAGFQVGYYVNPSVSAATIEDSQYTANPNLGVPETGIWAGNFAYPTTEDSGTIVLSGDSILGPGGGANSSLAGGSGIVASGASLLISDNTVRDWSAFSGADGYDWWEGTQSVGILFACPPTTSAADCVVTGNSLSNNTIGVTVILTNLSFSTALEAGGVTITGNHIDDSLGYGLFTEMTWTGPGAAPTSTIAGNTFDNTETGAPAMVLSGQGFNVSGNVFIGTSASGDQGPTQGEGGPSIATATVEATDYWTTGVDTVVLNANLFLDTDLYWSTSFFNGSASTLQGGELATFTEVGLPAATEWGVDVDGTSGSVAAPATIVADLQNTSSMVPFFALPVSGYTAHPNAGTFRVLGAPIAQTINFTLGAYNVTFTETGVPAGLVWYLNLTNGQMFSSTGATISFAEPDGNYSYAFGATPQFPKYYGALPGSFEVNGGPVTVHVVFTEARQVVLRESGLASGIRWWANFTEPGPYSFSSNASTLVFYLPVGSWTYSVHAANPDYTAKGRAFVIHSPLTLPHKALTFPVRFTLHTYETTVRESGLPAHSPWCVVLTGGATHCGRGTTITFRAANGTYDYSLTTTRAGYSGASGAFTVDGVTVVAVTFSS